MSFIKEILAKPLFKATSLNGISILLKISIGFITSKIIAIFVGPSGMALVGNLRNFLSSTEAFATLGFENGVIKYVAEHKNEEEKLKKTLSTIFISAIVVCVVLSLVLLFFSNYFNETIFGVQYQYAFIFKGVAIVLPFYIGNIFLVATINGLDKYRKVIYINIIGSFIGLLVSFLLIYKMRTDGALLSIIITPSLLFIVSFFSINKEIKLFKIVNYKFYNLNFLKSLSSYSLMALVSSVFGPIVLLAIRKNIILNLGTEQAGFWEAISRVSSYYMLFITTILMIYFLPKLAASKNNFETKNIFFSYYKGIIPVFIIGLFMVYFLRGFLISILFTNEFQPISKLFFWQLIGDFFKALSIILGINFYARKMTKGFIITELCSLAVLYFSNLFFLSKYGIEGVVMAHAFTYFIYLITLIFYFRNSLFVATNEKV